MEKKRILFVCTGNIFRSFSAEYCLKQYLLQNGLTSWQVKSAGIAVNTNGPDPKTVKTLHGLGITDIDHEPTQLTNDILRSSDVIIAMAQNHVNYIKDELGDQRVVLFNQLAKGEATSVWDIEDEVSDPTERKAVEEMIERTVRYIHTYTKNIYQTLTQDP